MESVADEVAFYWHYFYLFKVLLSQVNYVYYTHLDDWKERLFGSQKLPQNK